jgi:hypothetical protein
MSLTFDQIAADTPCPGRLGGKLRHYPLTRHGKAVRMPGPDDNRVSRTAGTVMLARCSTVRHPVYLVPPHEAAGPDTPLMLCLRCRHELTQDTRQQLVAAAS